MVLNRHARNWQDSLYRDVLDHPTAYTMYKREQIMQITPYLLSKNAINGPKIDKGKRTKKNLCKDNETGNKNASSGKIARVL